MNHSFLSSQTDDDFSKAHNKALINEIQHLLNPEEARLISLQDMKTLLKPKNEVYKGMEVIPVKLIVGSEGRYSDFDNHFFPKSNFLKNRWERVDMAHYQDIVLPAISVYELGGLYFVRDGNHRVSVAKSRGIENIDAEVVSLQTEIKLKPGSTKQQMIKQVIEYEKRVFYMETSFGDITDYWCLDFSTPGQYDVIYNHILGHKYYINSTKSEEIPMEEAVLSWFQNVYLPVVNVINKRKIIKRFSKRTIADLYVFLIKYWDELKQKFGNEFPLEDAARDFTNQFGKLPLMRRITNFFQRRKMKKDIHQTEENGKLEI
ncbi:MAG: transcriptional regulator [Treponema sp.]|nr:transcriptional regulator [Spirochaetia bacterium]MDD7459864.1 transcriptional regulator [Spirochaetales bacterium]MDY5812176.1 transcriptional regulator [Treponema sp.]MEE1182369.1 transcriptional regulator [Treponema sp.]